MLRTVLECQVSKMVNSDACPRPTTQARAVQSSKRQRVEGGEAGTGGGSMCEDCKVISANYGIEEEGCKKRWCSAGRNRYGVQGVHLNLLGLFLCPSILCIWGLSACLPS